jgi:hypothetical protein
MYLQRICGLSFFLFGLHKTENFLGVQYFKLVVWQKLTQKFLLHILYRRNSYQKGIKKGRQLERTEFVYFFPHQSKVARLFFGFLDNSILKSGQ